MQCEQAQQLFDAYLDGQLSPALATELGAHRLHCAQCRRALALLEVSGHILASDRDPVAVDDEFSDRLLACMDVRRTRWVHRLPRILYIVGPLAAAAVIVLAFMGVFDANGKTKVAGHKEVRDDAAPWQDIDVLLKELDGRSSDLDVVGSDDLQAPWLKKVEDNVSAIQQSGQVLRQLPLSILQPLEELSEAKDDPAVNQRASDHDGKSRQHDEAAEGSDADNPDDKGE